MRFCQILKNERYMTLAARKASRIMSNVRASKGEAKDSLISIT